MKSKIVDVFITLGACYLLVEAGFNMYPVIAAAAAATEPKRFGCWFWTI